MREGGRWGESWVQHWRGEGAVGPKAELEAVLGAFPDAGFDSYRLPERSGDAAMIRVAIADGDGVRDVFVSPQGEVLGSLAPESRLMELDKRIRGPLLLGKRGSWLVELAASWASGLILSGLYLLWPRGRGVAGRSAGRRVGKGGGSQGGSR